MSNNRLPGDPPIPDDKLTTICASCQVETKKVDCVKLPQGVPIPVCPKCWNVMPISERLRHSKEYADRLPGGHLHAIFSVIGHSFAHFLEERKKEWNRSGEN